MKKLVFFASYFLVFILQASALTAIQVPSSATNSTTKESADAHERQTPLEIVNKRMQAYNDHDLEGFLKLYADDFKVYTYPDRLLGKGKKHLRKIFEPMFKDGVVKVEIHHQLTKDSYVINHETVDYGNKKQDYISIYKVRDGLIKSVRFVRD